MKSILLASALALAGTVWAEESTPEIIVTAERQATQLWQTLPTSSVITREDIRRQQPRDLGQLLGSSGGVSFRDSGGRGSVGGLFVRGTTPAQTVILVDGVRTSSATLGATALEFVPLDSIQRVEIVRGPLSGLYGADAIGGVIQIFTERGGNEGVHGGVVASAGSHNSSEVTLNFDGGTDRAQIYGSVNRERTGGFDRTENKTGGNGDRDGYDEWFFNLGGRVEVAERVNLGANIQHSESRVEFDNIFGADNGFETDGELDKINTHASIDLSDWVELQIDVGFFRDDQRTDVFASQFETERRSASVLTRLRPSDRHHLVIGIEYYDDEVDASSTFTESSRDNTGYFSRWNGHFDRWHLSAGLRLDDNEAYGSNTTGSVAAGYDINDSLTIVASYGEAFRAPTFNDLYFPFFGNPAVKPEESRSYELSVRGQHEALGWRVSAFRTEIDNLIGSDPDTFISANIAAEAELEGVEAYLDLALGAWSVSASLDYLEARDADTDDFLTDRTRLSFNGAAGRTFGNFELGLDVRAEHGRHDSGVTLGGFAIWGLRGAYQINERLRVSGRVDNVGDKDYSTNFASTFPVFSGYESGGRMAKITLGYQFN